LRLADLVVRLVVEIDLVDGAAGGDDEQVVHGRHVKPWPAHPEVGRATDRSGRCARFSALARGRNARAAPAHWPRTRPPARVRFPAGRTSVPAGATRRPSPRARTRPAPAARPRTRRAARPAAGPGPAATAAARTRPVPPTASRGRTRSNRGVPAQAGPGAAPSARWGGRPGSLQLRRQRGDAAAERAREHGLVVAGLRVVLQSGDMAGAIRRAAAARGVERRL